MQNKFFTKKELIFGVITGVLSTLVIMWFIEPLTNWLFPKMLSVTEHFTSFFVDYIYRSSACMTIETTGIMTLAFSYILVYLALLLLFAFSRIILNVLYQDSSEDNLKSTKTRSFSPAFEKNMFKLSSVLCIILILMFTLITMSQIFSSSISSCTLTNIEIVSPYIADQEYKQLKSDFYTITSKQDFDELRSNLQAIADEYSLQLKE